MTQKLNLARQPFVDSRPANLVVAVLAILALALTFAAAGTVRDYVRGSARSRASISALKTETAKMEAERADVERVLARVDLATLSAGTQDANALARRRVFSWTRFLTRLEKVLPNDVRVTQVALSRRPGGDGNAAGTPGAAPDATNLQISLVSRDPDGMSKVVRAFYASEHFDRPEPVSEQGPEKGVADGTTLNLSVTYRDAGRTP